MKKKTIFLMLAIVLTSAATELDPEPISQEETNFQTIEMVVDRHGWTPNSFVLKKDIPVKWKINAKELTYCNDTIIIPNYDLKMKLKKGEQVIEFTPKEAGEINWSCWMNMIPGQFVVTEELKEAETQIKEPEQKIKSCCSGKK